MTITVPGRRRESLLERRPFQRGVRWQPSPSRITSHAGETYARNERDELALPRRQRDAVELGAVVADALEQGRIPSWSTRPPAGSSKPARRFASIDLPTPAETHHDEVLAVRHAQVEPAHGWLEDGRRRR
jgi:hypothetical protein